MSANTKTDNVHNSYIFRPPKERSDGGEVETDIDDRLDFCFDVILKNLFPYSKKTKTNHFLLHKNIH